MICSYSLLQSKIPKMRMQHMSVSFHLLNFSFSSVVEGGRRTNL